MLIPPMPRVPGDKPIGPPNVIFKGGDTMLTITIAIVLIGLFGFMFAGGFIIGKSM